MKTYLLTLMIAILILALTGCASESKPDPAPEIVDVRMGAPTPRFNAEAEKAKADRIKLIFGVAEIRAKDQGIDLDAVEPKKDPFKVK